AQIKADPTGLAQAPAADRMALIKATQAFEAILGRHARAVEAARIISEGLVRTLAAEIRGQRGVPNAYGATGHATPTDGSAVAFSRSA
ncbi:MAG TPA: flagellar basal-body protein FlbY, partial [Brevundimonas sp.]|nr:flagellar basal-body protein FlbY [Brevundimonas sp.]